MAKLKRNSVVKTTEKMVPAQKEKATDQLQKAAVLRDMLKTRLQ